MSSNTKNRIKKLLTLALPLFLEMFFANLLSIVDTLMIGKYDETSVAAIGNATTVLGFLTVLFNISAVGVSIIVSQYIGAKKIKDSKKVLSQGIIFNLILSLIVACIFIFLGEYMLKMIHTPEEILIKSKTYLMMISFTLPLQALTSVMSANLKANGKPFYITIVSFSVNIINVIVNYLLIFGNFIFPELGYKGAAIATMCCHTISFIAAYLITRKILKQNIFKLELHKEELMKIIKIGGPSALENVCYNVSQLIVLSQVNLLLTNMVTARSYLNSVLAFVYMFSSAFGAANSILVGYSVGNNNYKEARTLTHTTFFICIPIIELVIGILNIFGRPIFSLLTSTEEILNVLICVLPVLFLLESGRCVNLIYISALKSSSDVIYPVVVGVFSMFSIAAFGSFLFTQVVHLGLLGIFLAQAFDESFRAIVILLRFKTHRWENKVNRNKRTNIENNQNQVINN